MMNIIFLFLGVIISFLIAGMFKNNLKKDDENVKALVHNRPISQYSKIEYHEQEKDFQVPNSDEIDADFDQIIVDLTDRYSWYGDLPISSLHLLNLKARDLHFEDILNRICLLYTSPSPRDATLSRMPSSA